MADIPSLVSLFNVELIAAGFAGAVVHASRIDATAKQTVWFIVVGGLAANFVTPAVIAVASRAPVILEVVPTVFIAFGIGMSGKKVCYWIEKFFNSLDLLGKTPNE